MSISVTTIDKCSIALADWGMRKVSPHLYGVLASAECVGVSQIVQLVDNRSDLFGVLLEGPQDVHVFDQDSSAIGILSLWQSVDQVNDLPAAQMASGFEHLVKQFVLGFR